MKCIFCLTENEPGNEHVIPESVGGSLRMPNVCTSCNSGLSHRIDGPFADSLFVQLARFAHQISGKRGKVPFPFAGAGITPDGSRVTLDRDLKPHVERSLEYDGTESGKLGVKFSADASDRADLDALLARPLRKKILENFPDWSPEKLESEIQKIIDHALTMRAERVAEPIRFERLIRLDVLAWEVLKISYEMWFLKFGYDWVENSVTAASLRNALNTGVRDLSLHGSFPVEAPDAEVGLPPNHHLVLQHRGVCMVRLFETWGHVLCEEHDPKFMLPLSVIKITAFDFKTESHETGEMKADDSCT